jgi:hypothetical protein
MARAHPAWQFGENIWQIGEKLYFFVNRSL